MPSLVIEAMRFEPSAHALVIAYRGRGVYRYFDVSEDEWREFRSARSKGAYLNREFKRRGHRCVKLDREALDLNPGEGQAEFSWPSRK